MTEETKGTFLQAASEKYGEQISMRALVQAIPYVGGSLDTLLAGRGTQIQKQRIESFLNELDRRLRLIEPVPAMQPTEELFDLMLNAFDGVVRARSEKMRNRFASVIASQISAARDWEEADAALRLISELTDLHIAVLVVAKNAPICTEDPFKRLQVISLSDTEGFGVPVEDLWINGVRPTPLRCSLPEYSINVLRMVCSELVSHNLLYDVGVGMWSGKPLVYLTASEFATWLFSWLSDEEHF